MTVLETRPGTLIENRYQVLETIGSGGMGTVFRVSDEAAAGEVLALKIMKVEENAKRYTQLERRFREEFRILTQLRHPHLVTVYDYGVTSEGVLYYTMEWVDGSNLHPGRSPLLPTETLPVMVQICRALAYLHARGVIHGDLKPQNVILTRTGQTSAPHIKLVDFGLAQEIRVAKVSSRYYTPDYAAPEAKEGRNLDQRTDLYSLGAVWFAMLMGEAPRFMEGPGKQRLIRFNLESDLMEMPRVPPALATIIARLLATAPTDRYPSANAVLDAVNTVTEEEYRLETRETARSYALRTHFVDREEELGALQSAWSAVEAGAGHLAVVGGEAGAGKSRLLEELETQVEIAGGRVLWGRNTEQGGSAYHPWRDVLRVLLRYLDGTSRLTALLEEVGPVLATLLPELWRRPIIADQDLPLGLTPEAARRRLTEAILAVLRAAGAQRPTVIVVEDVQWADAATLGFMNHLVEAGVPKGIFVAATYRSEETPSDHPLHSWDGAEVTRVEVRRLPPEMTTKLAQSMLGLENLPEALAARIQRATAGNALFVQELLRSLASEQDVLTRSVAGWTLDEEALATVSLPLSIQQVIKRRLSQIRMETQAVLRWASVMGEIFWESAVAAVGEVSPSQVHAALAEALDQGLVTVFSTSTLAGEREYHFEHLTVQEVSYATIPSTLQQQYHRTAAEWLAARPTEERDEYLAAIGEHYEAAQALEQAAQWFAQAGQRAQEMYAPETAIEYYQKALAQLPDAAGNQRLRMTLNSNLGEVLRHKARFTEAVTAFGHALAVAEEIDDVLTQVQVYCELSHVLDRLGEHQEALASAQRAQKLARAKDAQREIVEALILQGWALLRLGRLTEAIEIGDQVVQLSESLAILERKGAVYTLRSAYNLLGGLSMMQADYDQAVYYMKKGVEVSQEMGDLRSVAASLNNLGEIRREQGDYESAVEIYREGVVVARKIDNRLVETTLLSNLGGAQIGSGDFQGAEKNLRRAIALAQDAGHGGLSETYRFLADVLLQQDKAAEALTAAKEALAIGQTVGRQAQIAAAWHTLGEVVARLGKPLDIEAEVYRAGDCFSEAVDLWVAIGAPAERARTLRAWADYESKLGHAERGQTLSQKARDIFEELGMSEEMETRGL